jgi:hypothetical protein
MLTFSDLRVGMITYRRNFPAIKLLILSLDKNKKSFTYFNFSKICQSNKIETCNSTTDKYYHDGFKWLQEIEIIY